MILGIGVTAGSLLLGRKMYQCRTMIPARVTCWFCSHRETVWFNQRNSWNCGDCGQYNGFDKDGDYNQEIVGQHSDIPVAASMRFTQPQQFKEATNALCDSCNRNQEMKMHQLRNFMPTNLNNEDEEQAEYTAHLERAFRLCRSCKLLIILSEAGHILYLRILYPIHILAPKKDIISYPYPGQKKDIDIYPISFGQKICQHCHSF
jgi:hypothetical protein